MNALSKTLFFAVTGTLAGCEIAQDYVVINKDIESKRLAFTGIDNPDDVHIMSFNLEWHAEDSTLFNELRIGDTISGFSMDMPILPSQRYTQRNVPRIIKVNGQQRLRWEMQKKAQAMLKEMQQKQK